MAGSAPRTRTAASALALEEESPAALIFSFLARAADMASMFSARSTVAAPITCGQTKPERARLFFRLVLPPPGRRVLRRPLVESANQLTHPPPSSGGLRPQSNNRRGLFDHSWSTVGRLDSPDVEGVEGAAWRRSQRLCFIIVG